MKFRPSSSFTPHLTAVFRALATVDAAFTSFLAQETTAHDCQAGHQAAAVLLLLGRRSLLHGRRLLVAHLLGRVAILLRWWWAAVALLVLTLGRAECDVLAKCSVLVCSRCALNVKVVWRENLVLTRRTAAGTGDRCCSSLGLPLCAVCVCDRLWFGGATRLRA